VCAIIGYVGYRRCQDVLIRGLQKLGDRGSDSVGVAWLEDGRMNCVRAVGNLDALEAAAQAVPQRSDASTPSLAAANRPSIGVGHTRWATHGAVSERNAHPNCYAPARIRLVLKGIIENHISIRARMVGDASLARAETDAAAVAHLLAVNYNGDLAEAVRSSLADLTGHFAFVAMCDEEPETLVAVRHECPLVVGVGDGEQFVASSITGFIEYTRDVATLGNDEIAVLRPNDVSVIDPVPSPRRPVVSRVGWDLEAVTS
jgi:glucosamine--fructose-6-phosphate aminotransferase (isomerizing)